MLRENTLFIIILFHSFSLFGQYLSNPSFEGTPQMSVPPTDWYACNEYSTPDTHPTQTGWNFTLPASDGTSYLGLVMRGSNQSINDYLTEAAGSKLLQPLKSGTCYSFSIDLAFFPQATFNTGWEILSYDTPGRLLIWGGGSDCDKHELLWESSIIANSQWQPYLFKVSPKSNYTHLILEAQYADPSIKKYGNIIIDNLKITSEQIDLGPDKILCENDAITLGNTESTGVFLWSTGENTSQITVSKQGSYWLEVSKDGCVMKDTINIFSVSPFIVNLGKDLSLCKGDSQQIDVTTDNGSYLWSTGSTDSKIIITEAGLYQVTVTNGCETHTDEISISYRENCCSLEVPNVFTPNGDSFNDLFIIKSEATLLSYKLKVYNRWGQQIFMSDSIVQSWDGVSNGTEVAAGVYFWVSDISCLHQEEITKNTVRGQLSLIR